MSNLVSKETISFRSRGRGLNWIPCFVCGWEALCDEE
jgi:hypothetical protein